MASLHLVACSGTKWNAPVAARLLYTGDLFAKSVAYIEAIGAPWRILSAKHGLVHPDTILAPYDETLASHSLVNRNKWACKVAGQLIDERLLSSGAQPTVVFLAGRLYREFLADRLSAVACVDVPMAGLGIGQQKAWLAARRAEVLRARGPAGQSVYPLKRRDEA